MGHVSTLWPRGLATTGAASSCAAVSSEREGVAARRPTARNAKAGRAARQIARRDAARAANSAAIVTPQGWGATLGIEPTAGFSTQVPALATASGQALALPHE